MNRIIQIIQEEIERIQAGEPSHCFKNVYQYLLNNDLPNAVAVHGEVTSKGKTMKHAWIEDGDVVYDPTTGVKAPKEKYYSVLKPKVEDKHSFSNLLRMTMGTRNYGPWTDDEINKFLIEHDIFKEEVRKYLIEDTIKHFKLKNNLKEEYSDGKLYGYHCTPCKNIESIEKNGFKIGFRNMQGKGVYGFYNIQDKSSGNAAFGYGFRHIGYNFCIVKFEMKYPDWILILNKKIAQEVLGENADIVKQIERIFGSWDNYLAEWFPTIKPEYRTAEFGEQHKEFLRYEFDKEHGEGGKNILFGTANLEQLTPFGFLFDGEYGITYIIKSPQLMIPIGYHEVTLEGGVGKLSDFIPFTGKSNAIKEKIKNDEKYAILKPYLNDINSTEDLNNLRYNFEQKQMQVRNNREYDELEKYISTINDFLREPITEVIDEEIENHFKLKKENTNFATFDLLNEIGEGNIKPYEWSLYEDYEEASRYRFVTDSKLEYIVTISSEGFERKENEYDAFFSVRDTVTGYRYDDIDVVNRGEMFNVMATLIPIFNDFVKRRNPKVIFVAPAKDNPDDRRRMKLYLAYMEKHLNPNYTMEREGSLITITRKDNIKENNTDLKPDYRGWHEAPDKKYGSPLHDMTMMYGEDIYTPKAERYYGTRSPLDKYTIQIIQHYRNKPNKPVMIYRAVPKGVEDINDGDWVTINPQYAKEHGESHVENYHVISKEVLAKDIINGGESIHEWGYSP